MPEPTPTVPIFRAVGDLPFTGERMVPGRAQVSTELEHWQRYRYFRPFVRGRRVLDVACGEGYGAHYLAEAAAEVVGVDISPEAIDHARAQYARPNLSFRVGDAQSIGALGPFDAVVSFETIEHLQDPKRFLGEVRAALAPGGVFIVSTPNREVVSPGASKPDNPFHTIEWSLAEFKALLATTFPCVEFFKQPQSAPWDVAPGSGEKDLFFLAVCGTEPLAPLLEPVLRPTGIVIPVHNNLSYSDLCIRTLAMFTPEPIEIVIVDNGSTDRTGEWLDALTKAFVNVRVIRNNENRGFAPAVNQGLALLPDRDVVLLNNDVVVTAGWLGRMLMAMREEPQRGVVGPMCNYAADPQRLDMPSPDHDFKKLLAAATGVAARSYGQGFDAPRLSGFCTLIRREVVAKIGGLDERFVPGFFEDDDFGLRARLAGYRLWAASDVFVYHFGSKTFKALHADPTAPLQVNWNRFKEKWGIPIDLEMGGGYPCDRIQPTPFDPKRHFVPLPCSASA